MGFYDMAKKSIEKLRKQKPIPDGVIRMIPIPFASQNLTDERLLNDDTVYSVYSLFCNITLGSGWHFEGDDAEEYSELLEQITKQTGFPQMLNEIAACPFQRFSATEIIWDYSNSQWMPKRYRPLPSDGVFLNIDELSDIPSAKVSTTGGLQDLPIQNAVIARWRPTFKYPVGQSIYDHTREIIEFKRRADHSIIRYIERFGAPTIIGWYAPGTSVNDQQKLLSALKNLQGASYGVAPGPRGDNGTDLELFEPKGSDGGIGVALEMIQHYERRFARAVLGSVLAMFESQFGTRAQSETHMDMLKQVVKSYQADIEFPINNQLIKQVLRYNVSDDLDIRFKLNPPAFSDLEKTGQWIADLTQSGFITPEEDGDKVRSIFSL